MNDTRQAKVNLMGLQGAVSQVKKIYSAVKDSGINVAAVNENNLTDGDRLFSYINALHNAIGRNGVPVKVVEKPASSPSQSKPQPSAAASSVNFDSMKEEIKDMAVQALLDAERQLKTQKESERLESGKLSAEQWIEANGDKVISLASGYKENSERSSQIAELYNQLIRTSYARENSVAEKNEKIADKVSELDKTLMPLIPVAKDALENTEMTHWRLIKRFFLRRKSNPRWRNPMTYVYILIGLMYISGFGFAIWQNYELKQANAALLHENQVHRIVDVFMEPYATYRKERTLIEKCIEGNGLTYTWNTVLKMRQKADAREQAEKDTK